MQQLKLDFFSLAGRFVNLEMKIEFKKVPFVVKNFSTSFNSVKIEGTFCRISPSLIKIDSTLSGEVIVKCSRCGKDDMVIVDEKFNFFVSDGIYNSKPEKLVIEIENGLIDFDEIIQSEISSIYSDYHICSNCKYNDFLEKEY